MRDRIWSEKGKSGFTIVELIVIIAILGLMAVIAIPGFSSWLPNARLKEAARDVFSNFQLAKLTAIKRNMTCTITFNQPIGTTTYDYVVYLDADNDLEYDVGEEVITQKSWADYKDVSYDLSQGGGDGLTFTGNDEGRPTIAFRPNGLPRNNAGGFGAGTVFLKNTINTTTSVVVSSAGNIRIP